MVQVLAWQVQGRGFQLWSCQKTKKPLSLLLFTFDILTASQHYNHHCGRLRLEGHKFKPSLSSLVTEN